MIRYFVTGTDTGVGKTFVTCALARLARSTGKRVFAFKPIETGCRWVNGRLVGEDQTALVEAAGGWQTGELIGLYQREYAAAPRVADLMEGVARGFIVPDEIERVLEVGSSGADLVLVEGAGGWRVPVTDELDMGGLAARIGAPVIVVARATLGTINHSLLTIEAIERDGLQVAALVLSGRPGDDPGFAQINAEQIDWVWTGPILQLWDQPEALSALLISAT